VTPARKLAAWLLVAWTFGLILSIPMYWPYPRLVLPLLLASWIGVGVFAEVLLAEIQQAAQSPALPTEILPQLSRRFRGRQALSRARPILLLILIGGIGVAVTQHSLWSRGVPGWQPRNNLADLVPQIRDDLSRHAGVDPRAGLDQFVVYTYGEPALFFHLRASGCAYVKPVTNLSIAKPEAPAPRIASYVAFGSQAWITPGFGDQLAPALPRLQLVGKYNYLPSDIVLLDRNIIKNDRRQEYKLEIYFLK
jgi:dolichyl-phosphate-mannose-protein mannosyltransferase